MLCGRFGDALGPVGHFGPALGPALLSFLCPGLLGPWASLLSIAFGYYHSDSLFRQLGLKGLQSCFKLGSDLILYTSNKNLHMYVLVFP